MLQRKIKQGGGIGECRTSLADNPSETHSWRADSAARSSGLPSSLLPPKENWSLPPLFSCYAPLRQLSRYSAVTWCVSTASQTPGKNDVLFQRLANIFWVGLNSKWFRHRGPKGLCCNYATVSLLQESSHRHIKNEESCVPIRLHLQKQATGQIWPASGSLPTPILFCGFLANDNIFHRETREHIYQTEQDSNKP